MKNFFRFAQMISLALVCASLLVGSAYAYVYKTTPHAVPVMKPDDLGTLACGGDRCKISKNIESVTCTREGTCTFSMLNGRDSIVCGAGGCTASRATLAEFPNNHIPKDCPDDRCLMSFAP